MSRAPSTFKWVSRLIDSGYSVVAAFRKIADSAFVLSGGVGDTPEGLEEAGTYFAWIPSKSAFRVGTVEAGTWAADNIGQDSIGIGYDAEATKANTTNVGYGNSVTSQGSNTIGFACTSGGLAINTTIGVDANISGAGSFACLSVGVYTDVTGIRSAVIGSGTGPGTPLVNPQNDTMYIGIFSTTPTLVLQSGKCGIEQTAPLSTLDIAGNVGFKYTNLPEASETTKTLDASDLEYTFTVDLSDAAISTTYDITLPILSAADRRVYYFKAINLTGGAGSNYIRVYPNAADDVEFPGQGRGQSTVGGPGYIRLDPGDSLLIFGNGDQQVWWVQ